MTNDPISDMLTRIRNATMAKHHYVRVAHTKTNYALSAILKRQGFIREFSLVPAVTKSSQARRPKSTLGNVEIQLRLKYVGRFQRPSIHNLQRKSGSSLRLYSRQSQLPRLFNGMGIFILTTSHGIMTDQEARRARLGGEVICSIW